MFETATKPIPANRDLAARHLTFARGGESHGISLPQMPDYVKGFVALPDMDRIMSAHGASELVLKISSLD